MADNNLPVTTDSSNSPSGGYTGITPIEENELKKQLESLEGKFKETYEVLQSMLDITKDEIVPTISDMLKELITVKESFQDLLSTKTSPFMPNSSILSTTSTAATSTAAPGTGGGLLGGLGLSGKKGKDKPTIADMLTLPIEHSMGYLLLYYKLDSLEKLLGKDDGKKKSKVPGIGGLFSGLMQGAVGLAILAGALILFAGAMMMFGMVEWGPALAGLVAFGIFVTGMVALAKWLGKEQETFYKFGIGVATLTGSIILFAAAMFVMNWVQPYVLGAIPGILLFTTFVTGMAVLAKYMGEKVSDFEKFGIGVGILTASMILFAGVIFLMNKVLPYVLDAIPGIALFTAFVAGMAVLAKFVGDKENDFIKFGIGIAVLTGSLILFTGALYLMKLVSPMLDEALPVLGVFGLFVFGAVTLANAVKAAIKDFVLFGVGISILTGALILFTGAMVLMSEAQPHVTSALPILGLFGLFVLGAVALSNAMTAAAPLFLAFAAGTLLLVGALIAFAFAIKYVASIKSFVPDATEAIALSMPLIANLVILGPQIMVAALLFGPAAILLGGGLLLFATAMKTLGSIKEDMPAAITGLDAIKTFLIEVLEVAKGVDFNAAVAITIFTKSTQPLARAFLDFAEAMKRLGSIKGDMPTAIVGLNAIGDFITEDVLTLTKQLDFNTSVVLGIFARSTQPLARVFLDFAKAMKELGSIKDDMPTALIGLNAIGNFITQDVLALAKTLDINTAFTLAIFNKSTQPLAKAFLDFAAAMKSLSTLRGELLDNAIVGLNAIGDFISTYVKNLSVKLDEGSSYALDVFARSTQPLAKAFLDFAEAMKTLSTLKNSMPTAIQGLQAIQNFLIDPVNGVAAVADSLSNTAARKMKDFGKAVEPLASGLLEFTRVIEAASKLTNTGEAHAGIVAAMALLVGKKGSEQTSIMAMLSQGPLSFKDAEKFSKSIEPFSGALQSFLGVILEAGKITKAQLDPAIYAVDNATQLFPKIAVMLNKGNAGVTTKDLTQFNEAIKGFGESLTIFASEVISKLKVISIADISTSTAVVQNFGNLFTLISNTRFDANDIKKFSGGLSDLAGGMNNIVNKTTKVAADTAKSILDTVISIFKNVTGTDYSKDKLSGMTNGLSDLGRGLDALLRGGRDISIIKQLPDLVSSLTKIASLNLENSFDPITKLIEKKAGIDNLTVSLNNLTKALTAPKNSLLSAIEAGIKGANTALAGGSPIGEKASAGKSMEQLVAGIYDMMYKWDSATPGTITTTGSPTAGAPTAPAQVTNFIPVFAAATATGIPYNARDFGKK